jgi:hypothetical protein
MQGMKENSRIIENINMGKFGETNYNNGGGRGEDDEEVKNGGR